MKFICLLCLLLLVSGCPQHGSKLKKRAEKNYTVPAKFCVDQCVTHFMKNSNSSFLGGASSNLSQNPIKALSTYCIDFYKNESCCGVGPRLTNHGYGYGICKQ